jgi:hypothetical protein
LSTRAFERGANSLVARLGVLSDVFFRVGLSRHGIEVVRHTAAAESGVAGFAVEPVVAEDEGAVAGEALRLVDGERVGVVDVTGVEILRGDRGPAAPVEIRKERPTLRLDGDYCAALAVDEVVAVVVRVVTIQSLTA